MSTPFKTTIADGIAEMILTIPGQRFDSAGWFAIAAEIDRLGANDAVRVIIIGAAARAFAPASTSRSWRRTRRKSWT